MKTKSKYLYRFIAPSLNDIGPVFWTLLLAGRRNFLVKRLGSIPVT